MCVWRRGRRKLTLALRDPNPRSHLPEWYKCKIYIYLFGPFGGLTHPLIIRGNKQMTDTAYNEAQLIIFCAGKLLCFDFQVL